MQGNGNVAGVGIEPATFTLQAERRLAPDNILPMHPTFT